VSIDPCELDDPLLNECDELLPKELDDPLPNEFEFEEGGGPYSFCGLDGGGGIPNDVSIPAEFPLPNVCGGP
jgi:hypothetical protein